MTPFFLAAALVQAPATPPPPAADRDAICWVGVLDAYLRARSRTDGPPAVRDSPEERLREAMGYYLGVMRTRYTTDDALRTAMHTGRTSFQGRDPRQIILDCMSRYHQALEAVSPLVTGMMRGE